MKDRLADLAEVRAAGANMAAGRNGRRGVRGPGRRSGATGVSSGGKCAGCGAPAAPGAFCCPAVRDGRRVTGSASVQLSAGFILPVLTKWKRGVFIRSLPSLRFCSGNDVLGKKMG